MYFCITRYTMAAGAPGEEITAGRMGGGEAFLSG